MTDENQKSGRIDDLTARKLAGELGIDLRNLADSGPAEVAAEALRDQHAGKGGSSGYRRKVTMCDDSAPQVKIRHLSARMMEHAWKTIPHFYTTVAVNMTDVVRLRREHGATINDFVVAACAHSLREHPWVNASWNGEQAVELDDINIAMAVATDGGLYYPVLHHCDGLDLMQIGDQSKILACKACSDNGLESEDTAGATFTLTNMGMLGVESFSAIITPPQAAVLSVGSVGGEVIVDEYGEPGVALIMRMTLSADHRVLDGADAAEFLDTVRSYLEAPAVLVGE